MSSCPSPQLLSGAVVLQPHRLMTCNQIQPWHGTAWCKSCAPCRYAGLLISILWFHKPAVEDEEADAPCLSLWAAAATLAIITVLVTVSSKYGTLSCVSVYGTLTSPAVLMPHSSCTAGCNRELSFRWNISIAILVSYATHADSATLLQVSHWSLAGVHSALCSRGRVFGTCCSSFG